MYMRANAGATRLLRVKTRRIRNRENNRIARNAPQKRNRELSRYEEGKLELLCLGMVVVGVGEFWRKRV